MREIFRGWKRKVGTATLLLACLFMMAWMRSYLIADVVEYTSGQFSHEEFQSVDGTLEWWTDQSAVPYEPVPFFLDSTSTVNFFKNHYRLSEVKMEWSLQLPGVGVGNAPSSVVGNDSRKLRFVSYWAIVLPLTLLSVWLLLSESRSSESKPTSET